ncbi:MAG: carnitine dehydratase [Microbacterium sp. 69-7]|nr:CoA transferase [Microbacterium sp. SCN 69-37]ODT24667.1 MAG: carnitine dehydratase [Microbacterium sp. SCN 69-37]OJU45994.1 MAG: carnitine dehydratase [Microbacterium sp. 69-7]
MTKSSLPDDRMTQDVTSGPFAGLLIADFGRVLAGPYCTMLLADLGATVIKVESPLGDETRGWRPPEYRGESTYFLSINRNKKSVMLDFRDPDDLVLAQRLASRADVLTENFKPGGLRRFGLDYESVARENPGVIYASITGFGTAGGAGLAGYDLLAQALSGLMSVTGAPDTEGFRSGIAVFDVIAGLHTCVAITSALYHRQHSGEGQHVEVNLLSSALSGMVNQTGGFLLTGQSPTRMGNDHPSIYPYAPFPTGDGELILAIGNDVQFATFCDAVGLPQLAADTRFASNAERSAHRDELRPMLTARLASKTAQEWFDILSPLHVPCAPILDVGGGVEFATRIGLEPSVLVGRGDRAVPTIRNPITFSRTPATYRTAPPDLDQDSAAIRRWLQDGEDHDGFAGERVPVPAIREEGR